MIKWSLILGAIAILLIAMIASSWPSNRLKIVFCDVGQGDASLIIKGNFQMLIDGGPVENKLYKCLADNIPFWDRRIEVVVNTHPEADHINGLLGVARRYRVDHLLVNGMDDEKGKARELRMLIGNEKVIEVQIGDSLRYSDLQFDIFWSGRNGRDSDTHIGEDGDKLKKEMNRGSIVGQLRYKRFAVLFAADITEAEELAIAHEGMLRSSSILKVAHHGSKTSSSLDFLEAVKPKIAIVSVGKGNSFGHPAVDVLSRIDMVRASLWRTDKQGGLRLVSDGEGFIVQSQFPKK